MNRLIVLALLCICVPAQAEPVNAKLPQSYLVPDEYVLETMESLQQETVLISKFIDGDSEITEDKLSENERIDNETEDLQDSRSHSHKQMDVNAEDMEESKLMDRDAGEAVFADSFTKNIVNQELEELCGNLAEPVLKLCQNRMQNIDLHVSDTDGGSYVASWDAPENNLYAENGTLLETTTFTWLEARNKCRRMCMETVTFQRYSKFGTVRAILRQSNVSYIWTSGRRCDSDYCKAFNSVPLEETSWFWAASGERIPITNEDASFNNWNVKPWGPTGYYEHPQPDNAEYSVNGKQENCLAILNNIYNDGTRWHDISCDHKKAYLCEDSEILLQQIEREHEVELHRRN